MSINISLRQSELRSMHKRSCDNPYLLKQDSGNPPQMASIPRPIQLVSNTELYNRWAKVISAWSSFQAKANTAAGLRHRWQHPPGNRRRRNPLPPAQNIRSPRSRPSQHHQYTTPSHHRARMRHRPKHSQAPLSAPF